MKRGFMMIALLASLLMSGCSDTWKYKPIEDVNNLKGRRVGVNLAWEADYAVSGRKDVEIFRYDSIADMLMALNYDKIDAIAIDYMMAKTIEGATDGIVTVEPAFSNIGYVCYFGSDNEALRDEYDAFLEEFKKTEEYQDLIRREEVYDGQTYDSPNLVSTGTGKVIRLACDIANFPRCFVNPGETVPTGFDLEPFIRFANEKNYKIEYYLTDYEGTIIGLTKGKYDVGVGYFSGIYRAEAEQYGLFVSQEYDNVGMYFMQKNQQKITADIDAME